MSRNSENKGKVRCRKSREIVECDRCEKTKEIAYTKMHRMQSKMTKHNIKMIKSLVTVIIVGLSYLFTAQSVNKWIDRTKDYSSELIAESNKTNYTVSNLPEYEGKQYISINNNNPKFSNTEITTKSYEKYSSLDYLGRCGKAEACLGKELMPKEKRGDISKVHPTGWQYPNPGFYQRMHLIAYCLAGENDNERNLVTGTEDCNTEEGMEHFELKVLDYLKRHRQNHVMYRVTPVYRNKTDKMAYGIQMEAYSVEDKGRGIKFNKFIYNVQKGYKINYSDGSGQPPRPTANALEVGVCKSSN